MIASKIDTLPLLGFFEENLHLNSNYIMNVLVHWVQPLVGRVPDKSDLHLLESLISNEIKIAGGNYLNYLSEVLFEARNALAKGESISLPFDEVPLISPHVFVYEDEVTSETKAES